VTDFASLKDAFEKIHNEAGHIDILINNAGMGISGAVEHTSLEDAKYNFDVNFFGVFCTLKAVIPYMRTDGGGKIINISSAAAKLAIPFQAFYSATKAAVNQLTEAVRIEVKPFNIQLCSIMPGDVKTGFTSNRRKNAPVNEIYGDRIEKSIAVMEKDEQGGMPADYAGIIIYKTSLKRKLPLYRTIGWKYKAFIFLSKILPARFVNEVIGSIYGFIPKKK
jgi:short-subunit dehydrogenase